MKRSFIPTTLSQKAAAAASFAAAAINGINMYIHQEKRSAFKASTYNAKYLQQDPV